MAAEVERDERDGLDAGAAPRLHQELDCNGTGGGGGTRRSGRGPKPTARALACQGGTSRPARSAQPGQLEAGEEPASEDLRGASSEEEDEAEGEGARIPIDWRGYRAFYVKGTFIAPSGHRCEGCVEEEGSPPMSLSAWTTKCTGHHVRAERVMVVDADGQTERSLRDVLDSLSGSEDEEEGARIPIDCRGNRAFYVEGTFIASNGTRCKGFVEEEGSPPMSLGAWTTKCTGHPVSTREVMVVDADGQTTRRLRDVLDGLRASEDEEDGARIPIDCRGNRAFYVEGTFIASNGKRCKGFVEEEGSPPMSLGAWTTKCTGIPVSARYVMVVDADGQTERSLRDVLDGRSASEDEEDPEPASEEGARIPIDCRGNRAFYVKGTFIGKNNQPCEGFVHVEGLPPMSLGAWTKKYTGNRLSAQRVMVVDADGQTKRSLRDVLDGVSASENEDPTSFPGPQQQHGATPMEVKDEEIEIRKLAREGTPPPPLRPAAGQASRPKRSRPAARGDSKAAKRQKPAKVPAEVQPQAAAIAELRQAQALEAQRRDLREAELKKKNEVLLAKVNGLAAKVDGLAAKSAQQEKLCAQQEWLIAHLERFKAQVLEENEELRQLLLANGAVEA